MEQNLEEQLNLLRNKNEFEKWLAECDQCIRVLEQCLQSDTTVSESQRINATMARLKCLRLRAQKTRFTHRDADYAPANTDQPSTSRGTPSRTHDTSSNNQLIWEDIESAFQSRLRTGAIINFTHLDPREFLQDARELVLRNVQEILLEYPTLKMNFVLNAEFITKDKKEVKALDTKNSIVPLPFELEEWYADNAVVPILHQMEEFQERDSGWALSKILYLLVNINKYTPMRAGCKIKLPEWIKNKRACVNVQTNGQACFAWSVAAAMQSNVNQNTSSPSSFTHYRTMFNLSRTTLPMKLENIKAFEEDNNVLINVFVIHDNNTIAPLRLAKFKSNCKYINLLLLEDTETNHFHFVCIRNLSRLTSSQLSRRKCKKHICNRCLHYFSTKPNLDSHYVDCSNSSSVLRILPTEEDKILKFKNYNHQEFAPFVVYADFECFLQPIENELTAEISTVKYQKHVAHSVGYYVKTARHSSDFKYKSYRGIDPAKWFAKELFKLASIVRSKLENIVPMKDLTAVEENHHSNASCCHICGKAFGEVTPRIRDHCHLTGKYRGPAHSNCNLNYQEVYVVPIIFHNLSGYDAHFIIKEFAHSFKGRINLLPINKEKYISFTKYVNAYNIRLRFIDSFKFLSSNLNNLSSYLNISAMSILKSEFSQMDNDGLEMISRKCPFPYDYVDSMEKLNVTTVPARKDFYNKLNDSHISDVEYLHFKNIWRFFDIKNLGQYSDLYLKIDVLLLADVFENFRKESMQTYSLDPAHYFTLPGFTWDAMLKYTDIEFELLTDIDMILFIERGIRGGLSQCSARYAKANNKYMEQSYNENQISRYLMYFDVNNLYGWAMCQSLPKGNFKWSDAKTVEKIKNELHLIAADSAVGYILEVDLSYPQHLHDLHADLPFCPNHEKPPGDRTIEKLLATLHNKTRYVLHYRLLQQCSQHGLKITKIHRILQFDQSKWLAPYINLNTRLRTTATNNFTTELYKLMNNAIFGKTMENVLKRVDVKLLTYWKGRYGAETYISKPNFHSRSIFEENLVAIELKKLTVKFDKPIYVGMSILDISKIQVYSFHYDYMKPTFHENCRLMYTDTDSLIYSIECDDIYEIMKQDICKFDTSNFSPNNIYGMPLVNKKVPGLMKDENSGNIMLEFVGLRSKMYAIKSQNGSANNICKKAKGIKKCVIAKRIKFKDYLRCLQSKIEIKNWQSCIRTNCHDVYTVRQKKISLSPYDDKRFIKDDDTYETLPWGHYKINQT